MSRLSQIRFALFLILCTAIVALNVKHILDIERPTAPPEMLSLKVRSIIHYRKSVALHLLAPVETVKKMALPEPPDFNRDTDGMIQLFLELPQAKTGVLSDSGNYLCELKLYPTGKVAFSRIIEQ